MLFHRVAGHALFRCVRTAHLGTPRDQQHLPLTGALEHELHLAFGHIAVTPELLITDGRQCFQPYNLAVERFDRVVPELRKEMSVLRFNRCWQSICTRK